MTDLPGYEFTICMVKQAGHTAAKTITRDTDGVLWKKDYDDPYAWAFVAVSDDSRDAAAAELARYLTGAHATANMAMVMRCLAKNREWMIIMGAPKPGLNPAKWQRRVWASSNPWENTLLAVPRAWLPVDCDDIEVPHGLGRGDRLPEAAMYIRDHKLPPEFADVQCVGCATASSGLKGPSIARLRMFFPLDQVHALARLRKWGVAAQRAGLPVDPAVLQVGQPIFTARPTFIGMDDPVPEPQWAFVVPGATERVSLVADRYDVVSAAIERKVSEVAALSGGDWRRLLNATLGGPTRFFEPLTRALGLAAHTRESENAIVAHVEALLAERADLGRQSQYNRRWIAATLRRFRGKDVKTAEQVEFLRNKLFG